MLRKLLVMPVVYGLLVIFAACAQPGAVVGPTEVPATATAATMTATDAPPATPTQIGQAATTTTTPLDAPTTDAAATATVTATEQPPASATPTASRTPTAAPTESLAAPTGTPVLELLDMQTTTTTSPDGLWVAVSEAGFPVTKEGAACAGCSDQYWARFTVRRADGSMAWLLVAEWRQMGLGYGVPGVLQWAAGGAALYFTELTHADGCGFFSSNGSSLKRLDLGTGAVVELLPAQAYYLALSPDETRLAYLAYGQRGLVVRDLATGAERDYPLADLGGQAGAAVWAPDGSAVALTMRSDACGGSAVTHMVIDVTLADGARRVLLPPEARQLTTVAWPEAGRLRLVDGAGQFWGLNTLTGQVTPEG